MNTIGVAVIGCGTVGGATAKILTENIKEIQKRTGKEIVLKYIVDLNFDHAKKIGLNETLFSEDYNTALNDKTVSIVVELVGGLSIAKTIMERALKAGKNIVTANKALLAHYGKELFALAREKGVSIGFEASCGGGIPVVKAITDSLLANNNEALFGIVNGTCNYILTEMTEKGQSFKDALANAQALGLAEADPTLDINGMDSAHKLALMGSLLFEERIDLETFPVKGIDSLDIFDVKMGLEMGYVVKLLAIARKESEGLALRVAPVFISTKHPLSRVSGAFNAISLYGDAVGHTMYYGRGAGDTPTASAVIADIIGLAVGSIQLAFNSLTIWPDLTPPAKLLPKGKASGRFYVRVMTEDKPGVISKMASALSDANISITSLRQSEHNEKNGFLPVAVTTHLTTRGTMEEAVKAIEALPEINSVVTIEIVEEQKESFEN